MSDKKTEWKWQKIGTSWHSPAIYHLTASCADHQPRLGRLVIPKDDAGNSLYNEAWVDRTELGMAIYKRYERIPEFRPEIKLIAAYVMPDHFHAVIQVTEEMPKTIREVMRGFAQGCNAEARALGLEVPVFAERVFLRPLARRGQLQNMIEYVHDNPRRAAVRKKNSDYFYVKQGVEIEGQRYAAVGNILLLSSPRINTVHVHKELVWDAEKGNDKALRDYMNGCVLAARDGAVSVSPFISPKEAMVRDVLIREGHPIIYLRDNGFPPGDIYKPSGALFDLCAAGKLLLLAPWPYDPMRENRTRQLDGHVNIARSECVALNGMADSIAYGKVGRG